MNQMIKQQITSAYPYSAPLSREMNVDIDLNFLASGDFGQGGYPGQDLEPGDEFDL